MIWFKITTSFFPLLIEKYFFVSIFPVLPLGRRLPAWIAWLDGHCAVLFFLLLPLLLHLLEVSRPARFPVSLPRAQRDFLQQGDKEAASVLYSTVQPRYSRMQTGPGGGAGAGLPSPGRAGPPRAGGTCWAAAGSARSARRSEPLWRVEVVGLTSPGTAW